MFYVDTSVLVSAFVQEKASEIALRWIADRSSSGLAISDWTITEFSSALGIKIRTAQIEETDRSRALAQFYRMIENNLTVLEVKSAHFRTAAAFTDFPQLALRGGDALHLAIASDNGLITATLDQQLANAGPPLDILTELLG